MTRARLRAKALRILQAGLAAVEPGGLVRAHLRAEGRVVHAGGVMFKAPKKVFMISVGKAALPMARTAHEILGKRINAAIVIAPSAAPPLPRTRSFVAGHPIPNAAGVRAGKHVIKLLEQAKLGDLVLLLLSGGASALMPAPKDGVSLRDKRHVTRLLLSRGATIGEINSVRKQLSRLKGGGFARIAAPARVIALALSDVPGESPGAIGSGPTVADPRASAMARRAIGKFLTRNEVRAGVRRALSRTSVRRAVPQKTRTVVIGSGRTFAEGAARGARKLGFRTRVLVDALKGEARLCGPVLVAQFEPRRRRALLCLIATGETVVRVCGKGAGGRNQELALSAIAPLARLSQPTILATFATDGVDGQSSAAGGLVDDRTQGQAIERGVSIQEALDRNDSNTALRRLGGLILTGPTGTNVADVTLILG